MLCLNADTSLPISQTAALSPGWWAGEFSAHVLGWEATPAPFPPPRFLRPQGSIATLICFHGDSVPPLRF